MHFILIMNSVESNTFQNVKKNNLEIGLKLINRRHKYTSELPFTEIYFDQITIF